MARLLAEKHFLVATGAALLQVPIRQVTQPQSQRWHRKLRTDRAEIPYSRVEPNERFPLASA